MLRPAEITGDMCAREALDLDQTIVYNASCVMTALLILLLVSAFSNCGQMSRRFRDGPQWCCIESTINPNLEFPHSQCNLVILGPVGHQ